MVREREREREGGISFEKFSDFQDRRLLLMADELEDWWRHTALTHKHIHTYACFTAHVAGSFEGLWAREGYVWTRTRWEHKRLEALRND